MGILSGKIAIVTGGNGVLGSAIAYGLSQSGVKVGILGRNEDRINQVVSTIQTAGDEAIGLVADVCNMESLKTANKKVVDTWGEVDILVNAAGGNEPGATILPNQSIFDINIDSFDSVVDLNLKGTLLPILAFCNTNKKELNIVNISSMAAQQALTRVAGYSAAKAGVDALTRWLSVEMATKYGEGFRVNAVAPGFFIGSQNKSLLLKDDGSLTERGQQIIDQTPMKRFGKPEELVGVVNWLCSSDSSFVTGTIIPIDGGFSAFSGV